MSLPKTFTTPAQPGEAEIVVKKSRFIGHVFPIKSVDEAETYLSVIREQYKTANHNCYAYTVGLGVPVERYSDDSEPSGTAGRPILDVLRHHELSNLLVVVTRYFGGTLLGTGGLVRAYTDGTLAALSNTTLVTCRRMSRIEVSIDYGFFGRVQHELASSPYDLTNQDFGAAVTLEVYVPTEDVQTLSSQLADWTNGQAQVEVAEPNWVGVDENNTLVHGLWPDEDLSDEH